mgnify:CR=1 FL=1
MDNSQYDPDNDIIGFDNEGDKDGFSHMDGEQEGIELEDQDESVRALTIKDGYDYDNP